jgi:ABC-type branched-subunit amino acid transport system ATPase component/branched-subunit amino acid ABC-type transport system permease component
MLSHFGYLLLGAGNGAVYAALAVALVVTYRSSGVVNFASGSIALYTAYVYSFFRQGKFLPLVPGLPKTFGLPFRPGFWVALLMALAMSAILGLLLYLAVFRPLRSAPPVARLVASIGVQIAIVLLIVKEVGTSSLPIKKIFPDSKLKIGSSIVKTDRLWFGLTVIVIGVVIGGLFKFTRFGLATRAAAETETGAVVSGISPNRVAAINWMLSSALAGVSGILIAPLVSLVPVAYSLFIVPALAAAVLSRFEFLTSAIVGGFVIGMLQSEAGFLKGEWTWFPSKGAPELIPLVMILLFLVLRGKPMPARGALLTRTLGRAPRPRHPYLTGAIAFGAAAVAMLVLHREWRQALILSFIFATISLSLVVVSGYAGQISLAQLTLAGTAAYSMSYFIKSWNVPFPIAPVLAALVATVIGVIVGLPALRVRGLSVAVVTLALAVGVDAIWFRNTDIVGNAAGVTVGTPKLFGVDLSWGSTRGASHLAFGFLCLVVLAVVALGVALLRRSRLGSAMVAVRANERSAAAAGVDVVRVKLLAFAIGSFIAGLGGAILAYRYGTASYDQFNPLVGLSIFATVYLAGITSVSGGVVAGMMCLNGIIFVAMEKWLSLGKWYQLVTSVLLIVTVINNPEGIVGPNHGLADRLDARRRRRRGEVVDAGGHGGTGEAPEAHEHAASVDLASAPALLSLENVRVTYGGVVAVADVSFSVPTGAIVGLIGPNGAGKTTLIDAMTGFAPCSGTLTFFERDLSGQRPHERVKHGLSRTFQAIELYEDLTVQENLAVGLSSGRQGFGHSAAQSLEEACDVLGISHLRDRPAGDLSQGQRQLVSIGRALVGRPKLLLLDEPAAGLDTTESAWLGERLRGVRDKGVTILMVDHDVNLVLGLCDYIVVLDFGEVIAKGVPSEIRGNRRVIEAYLGSTHTPDPMNEEATR